MSVAQMCSFLSEECLSASQMYFCQKNFYQAYKRVPVQRIPVSCTCPNNSSRQYNRCSCLRNSCQQYKCVPVWGIPVSYSNVFLFEELSAIQMYFCLKNSCRLYKCVSVWGIPVGYTNVFLFEEFLSGVQMHFCLKNSCRLYKCISV